MKKDVKDGLRAFGLFLFLENNLLNAAAGRQIDFQAVRQVA